jgi:hypothetical protein
VSRPPAIAPDGRAHGAHGTPDAQGLVALGSLGEHVHHDREGSRQDDCRPETLDPAHDDEEGVGGGQTTGERRTGEDGQAGHEQAPAAQQVGGSAAEEEEAPEGQPVGGDHPLQVGLGKVKLHPDGRQGRH